MNKTHTDPDLTASLAKSQEEIGRLKAEIDRLNAKCRIFDNTLQRLGLNVDLIGLDLVASRHEYIPDFWIGAALGLIKVGLDEELFQKNEHNFSPAGMDHVRALATRMLSVESSTRPPGSPGVEETSCSFGGGQES